MAKRETLQLAHDFEAHKHDIANCFMSEKLDGFRGFWDGGVSRGLLASEVPWANTAKDTRYKEPVRATGLWTRYWNVIHAPDYWLDSLPNFPLDGELYIGRGQFQKVRSVCSKLPAQRVDNDWRQVTFRVFDVPSMVRVLADGEITIRTGNVITKITLNDAYGWFNSRATVTGLRSHYPQYESYQIVNKWLQTNLDDNTVIRHHEQVHLPPERGQALDIVTRALEFIHRAGGEGLMLRRPTSVYLPERTYSILKMKKLLDAEATVVGYFSGEETDLGSRHLGRMGSLIVKSHINGKEFKLSGFTDNEREFETGEQSNYAAQRPGEVMPDWVVNPSFPRGTEITFTYRELSNDGIPKEARYFRRTGS